MTSIDNGPSAISGSCLCRQIEFQILFPKSHQWPPPVSLRKIIIRLIKAHALPQSATCQCTMCRKWTASLIASFIVVGPKQIRPKLSTFATYAEYESSPRRYRGFCSRCGSSLIWRSDDKMETWDLFLGCVDEEWLVEKKSVDEGKRVSATIDSPGSSILGKDLCTPNQYQYWWENVVPGVTDLVKTGEIYLQEKGQNEPLS
jgi:hypothetical protein